MDCACYQCPWRGDRRGYTWQVWRVWRNQERPSEPWSSDRLCEGVALDFTGLGDNWLAYALVYSSHRDMRWWNTKPRLKPKQLLMVHRERLYSSKLFNATMHSFVLHHQDPKRGDPHAVVVPAQVDEDDRIASFINVHYSLLLNFIFPLYKKTLKD